MGDWRGTTFPPLAPGPPPPHPFGTGGFSPPHAPGGGMQQQQHVHPPLSSLFAAVGSPPHHLLLHPSPPISNLLHSTTSSASDQSKAAAAAVKVKQACLPCKKAHTACDEYVLFLFLFLIFYLKFSYKLVKKFRYHQNKFPSLYLFLFYLSEAVVNCFNILFYLIIFFD
jgi:hypothetical protein